MIKKHALDALVGLLLSALLLILIEGSLWSAGIGMGLKRTDLSRGFDPTATYIVPAEGGGWHTRMGAGAYTERLIPARSDKTRVLMFGGSNTAGFPRQRLEDLLNVDAKESKYEVINLGRPGYGSERVLILFEQALRLLDPDIVVLYLGHNEFIEGGFALDLDKALGGGWFKSLTDKGARTRVGNLVADVVSLAQEDMRASSTQPSEIKKPETWVGEFSTFDRFTYVETQVYFDAYRQNLHKMIAAAEQRGVRVMLSSVIYNRFAAPHVSTFPAEVTEAQQVEFDRLYQDAQFCYPPFLAILLPKGPGERLFAMHFKQGKPGGDLHENEELPGRRPCMGALATVDPQLPPRRSWFPRVWAFYTSLDKLHHRKFGLEWRNRIAVAERRLLACLEICPDHPRALFELGLVHYMMRRGGHVVRERLEQAARYDRGPRKASGAINDIIREVAAEHPRTLFVDSDEIFAERMPMRLTGWEWMMDHCHLNIGARLVLMRDFSTALLERWPASEEGR
jgi:lysophospholipase L1-like esterase